MRSVGKSCNFHGSCKTAYISAHMGPAGAVRLVQLGRILGTSPEINQEWAAAFFMVAERLVVPRLVPETPPLKHIHTVSTVAAWPAS